MAEKSVKPAHMGTKFLGFVIGLVLAAIYTVKAFFSPLFDVYTDIPEILYVWAIFVIVIPAIVYLAEILWRYFHVYSEKLPAG